MKILKYLFFFILIIFIAGSIYIATKQGDYHFEESQLIEAPVELVFNEVNNYENWNNWSPWSSEDNIILSYTQNTSGQDAGFSWKSEDLGDGSIKTIEAIPYSSINQQLELETSVTHVIGNVYWKFEESKNGTLVTWGMKGDYNFKEKLAFTLQGEDLEDKFRKKMDATLGKLEANISDKMEAYSINVDGVTQHGGGFYMYATTATKINEVKERAANMIEQVKLYMKNNNISINGKAFVVYNQRNERSGTSIFSAAVPTPNLIVTPGGSPVLNGYLPPQRVVKTTLRGNYKNTPEAWEAAYQYINKNGMSIAPNGEPFEVFITNPMEVENPAQWVTEIYIPVENTTFKDEE